MSNAVSVLNGASYSGLAEVKDAGLKGMITLRGDITSAKLAEAVKTVTGCAVPEVLKATTEGDTTVTWMAPDELLVVTGYEGVEAKVEALNGELKGEHALVVNVSDARAYFTVTGAAAREVLAKLAPIDLSPAKFLPGDFRRTRLAQAAGAFWLDQSESFHIVCFRSVGDYMFNLLKVAADPDSSVGVYATE
ncbi:sarcosine oxidase subunit gamma [Epibacterium sp. SM1969]|uniref:Sarcosine oxidase subunit gamma n=1 Tax=Tritonibacter aquimaris TaxID=2663379 RepID=A0A844AXH3_9RHOB|nr:sarcosine oxidase subunit gamma family protein [Tritonibacter aquimaris]MQY44278.1 sarcosine oxidase subunit gamma [Tritonibacter aquimaris]